VDGVTPAASTAEDVSCRTKVPYATYSEAKRAWKHLRKQPGRHHLEIYDCRYCPHWHIGNPPGHQTYRRAGSPYTTHRDTPPTTSRHTPAPTPTDDTAPYTPSYDDPSAPYTTDRDTAA
jgi:hypothetical protein